MHARLWGGYGGLSSECWWGVCFSYLKKSRNTRAFAFRNCQLGVLCERRCWEMLSDRKRNSLVLSDEDAIEYFSDVIYRVAMNMLKNESDTQDVFQEVFLRFVKHKKRFESLEHAKAWFIRVTINCCKDFFRKQKNHQDLDSAMDIQASSDKQYGMTGYVGELPEKYRIVIHLHYYEQYKISEIAAILKENENTIKTRLSRAKKILKEKWEN